LYTKKQAQHSILQEETTRKSYKMWHSLHKRAKCINNAEVDGCEKYTSQFLTTGVPLIIGLSLFFILGIVLFVIVRRKRRRTAAEEAQKNREIDDDNGDVEMVITGPRNPEQAYKHWEARGVSPGRSDLGDPFVPGMDVDSRMGSRDPSPMKY